MENIFLPVRVELKFQLTITMLSLYHINIGGLDNVVVIWKRNGEGLLKYTHSSPVQLVSFSPNSLLLISCAEVSFSLKF